MTPKEWESENDWDSHRPLLYLAAMQPFVNNIIEAGVGYGSTPLLHSLKNKRVYSFETNIEWANKFEAAVISEYKSLYRLVDNDDIKRLYGNIDLFFVDCAPAEERKGLIEKFANHAKVIVAHDTEDGAEYVYGMKEILSTFKYRLDHKSEGKPQTTAVSNVIDVSKWEI